MSRPSFPKAVVAGAAGIAALVVFTSSQLKAQTKNTKKTIPATADQIDTYARISVVTFCEARALKIDFQKSMLLALTAHGQVLFGKHGGVVPGSAKPITQDQFLNNASFMTLSGAIQGCPSQVPAAEKKKFDEAVKKIKDARK